MSAFALPFGPVARRLIAADRVASRGYHPVYRRDQVNHCPGCGRSQWHVGRVSAECAVCETALPLEAAFNTGGSQIVRTVKRRPAGPQSEGEF